MSFFGLVTDLPVPDLGVREGDVDPLVFTLKNADGTAVNLSGKTVALSLRPYRGTQTTVTVNTVDDPSRLAIVSASEGIVRYVPLASSFKAGQGPYHGYFQVYTVAGSPQTVPQDREIWIGVLPAL